MAAPQPGEQALLKDEAKRIKAAIYAEYGTQIDKMMNERLDTQAQPSSPAEVRAKRIEELLSNQTPLRLQVRSCQHDAMQRLIEAAQEDAARGENVSSRLDLLLKLQADLNKGT